MNRMNIEGCILQSLRPRRDGVLLRSDVNGFGRPSQVSAALKALLQKGLIVRLDRGVYAKPDKVEQMGQQALREQAMAKIEHHRTQELKRARRRRSDPLPCMYVNWPSARALCLPQLMQIFGPKP